MRHKIYEATLHASLPPSATLSLSFLLPLGLLMKHKVTTKCAQVPALQTMFPLTEWEPFPFPGGGGRRGKIYTASPNSWGLLMSFYPRQAHANLCVSSPIDPLIYACRCGPVPPLSPLHSLSPSLSAIHFAGDLPRCSSANRTLKSAYLTLPSSHYACAGRSNNNGNLKSNNYNKRREERSREE